VNRLIIRAEEPEFLADEAVEIVAGEERFGCTFVALLREGHQAHFCQEGPAPFSVQELEEIHSEEYVSEVLRRGVVVMEDVTEPPFEQHFGEAEGHAGVALALSHEERDFGILTVHSTSDRPPSDEELELLGELADDLADDLHGLEVMEARRRAEQELKVLDRLLRHNLRNELNVIEGNVDLVAEDLEDEEDGRKTRRNQEGIGGPDRKDR